jgi:putative protease
MYTWNQEASAFWREQGIMRDTIPLELNEKELQHRDNSRSEMLIYGYLPVMVSAQCVRKNVYGCDRAGQKALLKDRYEKEFSSVCCCDPWKMKTTGRNLRCYNIVYNSIPYGLMAEKEQVERLGPAALRLAFTMEEPEQAASILQEFLDVYRRDRTPSAHAFTKGHFKRGAE